MIEIINYDSKYSLEVDLLDDMYWGNSEVVKVSDDIKQGDIVKLALVNGKVVGLLHFKIIGDLVDCYHVLIDENYRNQGLGTLLMKGAIEDISKRDVKTMVAHAVEHDGIVNARKLLKNYDFHEVYAVKNYWNSLYPGEYCKQCNSNCCHCGVVVFVKNL